MPKFLQQIDRFQQRYRVPAFVYAVIKKYGEDEAGRQAALLTYYAFLSLFPLILVLTTLTEYIPVSHTQIQDSILKGTTNYFPVLGGQLSAHVHTLHKNGFALAIGLLFTLYGARGVADALRYSIQHLWKVPKNKYDAFPRSTAKSFLIILIAGIGFVVASASVGIVASTSHGAILRILTVAINLLIWYALFVVLINISLPTKAPTDEIQTAAMTVAIGLVAIQALGGYFLKSELKNLDALYSYFALALGLFFWIYLQVQVVFYSLEIAAVRSQKLWPRSFSDSAISTPNTHATMREDAKSPDLAP